MTKFQVSSMERALDRLHIAHDCYIYVAAEAIESRFDPLIANIQLFVFYASKRETVL